MNYFISIAKILSYRFFWKITAKPNVIPKAKIPNKYSSKRKIISANMRKLKRIQNEIYIARPKVIESLSPS